MSCTGFIPCKTWKNFWCFTATRRCLVGGCCLALRASRPSGKGLRGVEQLQFQKLRFKVWGAAPCLLSDKSLCNAFHTSAYVSKKRKDKDAKVNFLCWGKFCIFGFFICSRRIADLHTASLWICLTDNHLWLSLLFFSIYLIFTICSLPWSLELFNYFLFHSLLLLLYLVLGIHEAEHCYFKLQQNVLQLLL